MGISRRLRLWMDASLSLDNLFREPCDAFRSSFVENSRDAGLALTCEGPG
jgi:hypothetical protein